MVSFAAFFAFGIWLLQQQAALPDVRLAWLPILLLPFLLFTPAEAKWQRLLRILLLAALAGGTGFFHASLMAHHRLSEQFPAAWQGKDIEVIGVVAELPRQRERGLSFAFEVEQVLTADAQVPRHILLSTYESDEAAALPLRAGERWQLTVRLKRPHGTSNPHGFDFEQWLLERDLRASGYVRSKEQNVRLDELVIAPRFLIERLREHLREQFRSTLGNAPYAGVLVALAIGDQDSIPQEQWQVFTRTGVNHLMSISGLHITMLAALAFSLTYTLWRRSPRLALRLPSRKAAAIAGMLVALAYALLSGYSVPAQRTVYMLSTFAAALLMSRNIAPSQILAAALLAVLLLDPWAVLAPGFWLSFGAVALILYVTANRLGQAHWLMEYGRVQWAMTVGLTPVLLAVFQQVSLVSPLANAFAIPLVSFVVVPLTLLGATLPFDWIMQLAHQAMVWCMLPLAALSRLPDAVWVQHAPPSWSIALGMLGALWLLLPRGFPARWLGLIFMLPMFTQQPVPPAEGALRMAVFDVGQGLAVLVQTHRHTLLYDTGPDFPGPADSGNRILVPALRAQGIARLDQLILTHDDLDHTGGALSVMQSIPVAQLWSSLPDDSPILQQTAHSARCVDGQRWEWDGVQFEILHPAPQDYANHKIRNNDLGCVLRVHIAGHNLLLAADIERAAEAWLLHQHAHDLKSELLVVPHHGSKTSSTPEFIAAVQPHYAIFTVGYRNRFGHPKDEVVGRYRAAGSELLRSDEDGAIMIEMDAQGLHVERYRKTHARYWQG